MNCSQLCVSSKRWSVYCFPGGFFLQLQVVFSCTCTDQLSKTANSSSCSLLVQQDMPDFRLPLSPEVQQGLGSSGFWIWRGIVEKGKWDLAFLELMEAKHIVTARESFVFLRIPDS